MNTLSLFARLRKLIPVFVATSTVLALVGCGLSGTAPATGLSTESVIGTFAGTAHGGQQPIYNATVNLYSAGTGGYGSAGTLLASTTTDTNGFKFTKLPNGSTDSGSSWSCPSSDPNPDPQIYLTAVGGNTQGTGQTGTNNTASAWDLAVESATIHIS